MNLLKKDVTLSMQPDWRFEINIHKTDAYIEAMKESGMSSQDVCYFCGANDGIYLELHHLDGNHDNFNDDNTVFACSLCHRYHHLGLLAYYKQAKIYYLPNSTDIPLKELGISNRAMLMFQYTHPDCLTEHLPFLQDITKINDVFKGYDSYELWQFKINKVVELKKIRKRQQEEIRDADTLKDEEARKKRLEEIELSHKTENEIFAQKYDIRELDAKHLGVVIEKTEKQAQEIKEGRFMYLANGISLLTLADALSKIYQQNPEKFYDVLQNGLYNTYGRMIIWYNINVMQSLNGEYTVDEKMHYLITRQQQQLRNRHNI